MLIVAIVVGIVATSGGSHKTAAVSSQGSAGVAKVDGQDPNQSGCSASATAVSGSEVPVHDAIGRIAGELILRYSAACQTMWGRVDDLEGHGRYVVYIDVVRPADQQQARFHTRDTFSSVFGNMLSVRPGCVYATAEVVGSGRRGPVAQTPCRTGPGSAVAAQPTINGQARSAARIEIADERSGVVLYTDDHGTSANVASIPIGTRVVVACIAPNYSGIPTINAFYLLETAPWRGLFASANEFANGAPVGVTTNSEPLDPKVKNCLIR